MSYTPLHVHTEYSIRDSCLRQTDYIKRVKELGLYAACESNHGVLHGSYKFYKKCKEMEVKPIVGIEFYYADDATDKGDNYHLMAYAKNNEGWKNLCELSSWSYINGFYRKPRIDKEILNRYKEGLVISSACCFSKFGQELVNGNVDSCNREIDSFKEMFGDDFYLEIMEHGIEEEYVIRDHYRQYGRDNGIKVISTTDSHYLNNSDKTFHNIFKQLAYGSVGKGNDDGFNGTGYHIWTEAEMLEKFYREELDNTNEIADKCNVNFKFTGYYLPKFNIPEPDKDPYEFLRDMCYRGLKEKGLDVKKEYVDRLEFELNVFHTSDLENYILIVADYMQWCKKNNIYVSPGRGSMAGALVCYLTDITKVDPLEYNLMLSRAVNPGRSLQYDFGV